MEHHFDVDIAVKYGVNSAIILNHLRFWIEKSKANGANYHDGCYWTYNSIKAFSEIFPYMNTKQISAALKKLEASGIIKTGNYNKLPFDRTIWYSITKLGYSILANRFSQNGKSDFPKWENDNFQNGKMTFPQMGEPIPDNIPYNIPDNKTDTSTPTSAEADGSGSSPHDIVNLFHSICVSYPKVRSLSEQRKKAIQARVRVHGAEVVKEVFEKAEASDFLKGKNDRNWSADFDWIMKDTNFAKILDGKYDNKDQSVNTGRGYHINYTIEG